MDINNGTIWCLSNHKVHRYLFSKDIYLKDMLEGILSFIHENIKIKEFRVGAENLIELCFLREKSHIATF